LKERERERERERHTRTHTQHVDLMSPVPFLRREREKKKINTIQNKCKYLAKRVILQVCHKN